MTRKFKVFHSLQVAHSALFRAADKRTRAELDLTATQLAVLFVLLEKDGQPISDISKALAMGKSSLTGLVKRMCEKGLVRRIDSSTDGRVTNIFLEETGRAAVDKSKRQTNLINRALLDAFTNEEQKIIERFLTHITLNANDIVNSESDNRDN